jgi:hypothetical protein
MREWQGPSAQDRSRDLEADLGVCERATPGPWQHEEGYVIGAGDVPIAELLQPMGAHGRRDGEMLALSRTAWPAALRRALAAEAKLERLPQQPEEAKPEPLDEQPAQALQPSALPQDEAEAELAGLRQQLAEAEQRQAGLWETIQRLERDLWSRHGRSESQRHDAELGRRVRELPPGCALAQTDKGRWVVLQDRRPSVDWYPLGKGPTPEAALQAGFDED